MASTQLEEKLWNAMDSLRGLVSQHEAFNYLMGLLFLKYLNDHSESTTDGHGNSKVLGWTLPYEAQWKTIGASQDPDAIAMTARAFDSHPDNQGLDNLLTQLGIAEVGKNRVLNQKLIHLVSEIDLSSVRGDELANMLGVDDYLQSGAISRDFYTPSELSHLIVQVLDPKPGSTIYDPASGTGGLLITALLQATRRERSAPETPIFGQEKIRQVAALAKMNMILQGVSPSSIRTGDTLIEPGFTDGDRVQSFDYVVSHLPVGMQIGGNVERLKHDLYNRFKFGVPGTIADLAFIEHIIASMNSKGRAAILVGLHSLFIGGREADIRRRIIEEDLIEAVLTLPGNSLPNTAAVPALLVFNKNKPDDLKGKILMINATEEYEVAARGRNIIGEKGIARIVQALQTHAPQARFAKTVSLEEIAEKEYVLTPATYIDLTGISCFLGGAVRWVPISELADIFQGNHPRRQNKPGTLKIIRGRDLSVPGLTVDDLEMGGFAEDAAKGIFTKAGDILIQRIGQKPRAYLVEEGLDGVAVSNTVYVARFHKDDRLFARYLVEFLNSNIGQSLLSTIIRGAVIPTVGLTELRRLKIPIPDKAVMELINNLYEVEQNFIVRINTTRDLRKRLFSIQDADQVAVQLADLNREARVLAESLVQSDDLAFQIRNFFPFPIAYSYRTLSSILDDARLYPEQLRVAENILAFLGSVGLVLASHVQVLAKSENTHLTVGVLSDCWRGGISPGDWQMIARDAGSLLRGNRDLAATESYSALWFKGLGKKESEFAQYIRRIVELKNDYKHDRGPKVPEEYMQAVKEMERLLQELLVKLAIFIQCPIRLVEDVDIDRRTNRAHLNTLVYAGDHPGLRAEKVDFPIALPKQTLFLELKTEEWGSLYPFISVQYCPMCKTRETYFIDQWDSSDGRVRLKSFDRGHMHNNDDLARNVGADLADWFQSHGPT